jgi:uroporphyrin-III C-methyltransferase/precorrin-2 dehydrogenase/sirohydrochlorin ferrochelatase
VTSHGYPVNLLLVDRQCVVVGGGAEAALRVGNLLEAGARVLLVGDEPTPGLELLASERLRIERRPFADADLDGAWLVVQTTEDAALAARVGRLCEARQLFFCAVDQPENSSYAHLALARAGSLTLAIGTEGRAPALGRRLREEFSRVLAEADAAEEVERLARLRAATPSAERREVLSRAVADVRFSGALRFRKD